MAGRLVFVANSMYGDIVSGGDIHTFHMTAAALAARWRVHFMGGHALLTQIEQRRLEVTVDLTDSAKLPPGNFDALGPQLRLLRHYVQRCRATLRQLDRIRPEDIAYANSDFWWDVWPVVRSQARGKLMVLGMDAPSLLEVALRRRPDVKPSRLPSLHYWLSQELGLRWFARCPRKRLLYVHPDQQPRLRRLGFAPDELVHVSNGIDVEIADATPPQPKTYDLVWTGRVHHQKGIDDLIETVAYLAELMPGLRVVVIGNVRAALAPRFAARGLESNVDFAGYVSEKEKFRLLKASRLFLMPSYYESWGIVIGEALACGVPVIAYDLQAYRAVFGSFIRSVPFHDRVGFRTVARQTLEELRSGTNYLEAMDLAGFKVRNSWTAAGHRFCAAATALT